VYGGEGLAARHDRINPEDKTRFTHWSEDWVTPEPI